jgi:cell division protein FtsN
VKRERVPELPRAEEPKVTDSVIPTAGPAPEKVSQPAAKMTHSVQVGAFRTREQAEKLAGTLKKKGSPAGILPVTDSKARTWHTVRIGDYPSRQEAVKHAEAFTSREKMECAVRPFEKL